MEEITRELAEVVRHRAHTGHELGTLCFVAPARSQHVQARVVQSRSRPQFVRLRRDPALHPNGDVFERSLREFDGGACEGEPLPVCQCAQERERGVGEQIECTRLPLRCSAIDRGVGEAYPRATLPSKLDHGRERQRHFGLICAAKRPGAGNVLDLQRHASLG